MSEYLINMELKVWVDGIKRVVCGVTDNTTCQDIVIALAQAMGRTGRFTLIEKWRENERPLAPGECPLLVLQKWGEFASEVKLLLYESGTRRKQKQSEKDSNVQKVPDRFTHNFTPPVKTSEAVIRRSLTFSGGRKQESNAYNKGPEMVNLQKQGSGVYQGPNVSQHSNRNFPHPEKVTSDGNSWSSNSSLSSQNSYINHSQQQPQPQQQQRSRRRSSSQDRVSSAPVGSRDYRQPVAPPLQHAVHPGPYHSIGMPVPSKGQQYTNRLPQNQPNNFQLPINQEYIPVQKPQNPAYQNHKLANTMQSIPDNGVVSNGPVRPNPARPVSANGPVHSSAFSPVRPRRNSSEEKQKSRISNVDIPVFTDHRKSSQKHDLEEYDLDSNFPDVVKETGQDRLIEEFRIPGGQTHPRDHMSREEEERMKLLHLVSMQNERIKMQDSQLEIIDTEISNREQKIEDIKVELNHVTEEITKFMKVSEEHQKELGALDNGTLIDDIEHEKQVEREIKNEITALRARLEKCENDLHQFQVKVQMCGEDLEQEHEVIKADEKRRREEEFKLQSEISELRKEVDERSKDLEEKTRAFENVDSELKTVSEQLKNKTDDLTSTEKELQRENMKFFQISDETKTGRNEGEDVLLWYNSDQNSYRPNSTVRRNQSSRSWREVTHQN